MGPIQCIADGVPGGAMDLYCWIHSTFSVPGSWGEINEEYGVGSPKGISQDQPHPGVAPPDEEVVHHKYYQWVVFVLFLQAACFHLPRLIWKHSEGGLMKMLVGNLTDPMMIINKGDRSDRIQFIKKYFKESMKSHGPYAMKFFFCELLCLLALNIINEKIYVFLWFWFVGVAIMSGLAIVYRIVVILVPSLRVSVICARALNQVPRSTVKALITSKSGWLDQVGDYWVIYLLSKNLNPIAMKELLEELKPVMAPASNGYQPAYPSMEMDEKESNM